MLEYSPAMGLDLAGLKFEPQARVGRRRSFKVENGDDSLKTAAQKILQDVKIQQTLWLVRKDSHHLSTAYDSILTFWQAHPKYVTADMVRILIFLSREKINLSHSKLNLEEVCRKLFETLDGLDRKNLEKEARTVLLESLFVWASVPNSGLCPDSVGFELRQMRGIK